MARVSGDQLLRQVEYFGDQFKLHRRVERKFRDPDGRSTMTAGRIEYSGEQIAGTVGYLGLIGEAGGTVDEYANPYDAGDPIDSP